MRLKLNIGCSPIDLLLKFVPKIILRRTIKFVHHVIIPAKGVILKLLIIVLLVKMDFTLPLQTLALKFVQIITGVMTVFGLVANVMKTVSNVIPKLQPNAQLV